MNEIKELIIKYNSLIKYAIFGVLTTVVNLAVYWLFTSLDIFNFFGNSQYIFATIIAWVISVTFAFITNKFFVFNSKDNSIIKEIISFFSLRLASLGIDVALMFLLVSIFNTNDLIAKIITNVLIIVLNYIFSKLFIFNSKDNKEEKSIQD